MAVSITPYTSDHRQPVLDLSIRAWEPVFPRVRQAVPGFVYDSFYPRGWRARQLAELAAVLDDEPDNVDVAIVDGDAVGWAPARAAYEAVGFERWPVARYFRDLRE